VSEGRVSLSSTESSKNTNVKSEINKLSEDKSCHFLEITVPINETSEHIHSNSGGHSWYTRVRLKSDRWTQLVL
jgi:iron uptake system EfeUOB component EfeO/EfeM